MKRKTTGEASQFSQEMFHGFEMGDGVTIPQDWVGTPQSGDFCPVFHVPDAHVIVFVDWLDAARRSMLSGRRFAVVHANMFGEIGDLVPSLLETDDFVEVLAFVRARQPASREDAALADLRAKLTEEMACVFAGDAVRVAVDGALKAAAPVIRQLVQRSHELEMGLEDVFSELGEDGYLPHLGAPRTRALRSLLRHGQNAGPVVARKN